MISHNLGKAPHYVKSEIFTYHKILVKFYIGLKKFSSLETDILYFPIKALITFLFSSKMLNIKFVKGPEINLYLLLFLYSKNVCFI